MLEFDFALATSMHVPAMTKTMIVITITAWCVASQPCPRRTSHPALTGTPNTPDPCNAIKCALQCESECGWSRPLQRCESGLETTQGERDEHLGDCTGVATRDLPSFFTDGNKSTTAPASPATSALLPASPAASTPTPASSTGDDGTSDSTVIIAVLAGLLFVVLAGGAAHRFCCAADREANQPTRGAADVYVTHDAGCVAACLIGCLAPTC